MSNHSGKTIEPLKPGDPPKFLDTKFANQFVRLYNAVMNLRLKNGRALISDTAIDLELDASAASGGGGSTPAGLPWQIELIADTGGPNDWRTFTVSPGYGYFVQNYPAYVLNPSGYLNSSGTGTPIVASVTSEYWFWMELEVTGFGVVAYLRSGESTALPAEWAASPFATFPAQGVYDPNFNSGFSKGYAVIGYVDTSANPAVIHQLIYDNQNILANSNYYLSYLGGPWTSGGNYRFNSVVTRSGTVYRRAAMGNGDDGGDPSGASDWVVFP